MIRKAKALDLSSTGLPMSIAPLVTYFFTIHYYLLLPKNRPLDISEE